jgi:uncharacterized protein (DUF1501 family)
VGSPHTTRSHFEAQHYMESGATSPAHDRAGWLNRLLQNGPQTDAMLPAVAMSDTVPEAMRGLAPVFAIADFAPDRQRDHGEARQRIDRAEREMFAAGDDTLTEYGRAGLEIHARLADIRRQYQPENGATYPRGPLGARLADVARLIKAGVGLRVAFVDDGGWDTHRNQGADAGLLAGKLTALGDGIAAFRQDLGDRFEDVVVLTMSEFGRTVAQNGTGGTDHGHGTAMFVVGGRVRGRHVRGRWPGLAPDQCYESRDLAVTTDFRDLFGEVAIRHMGIQDPSPLFPGHQLDPRALPGVLPR